MKKWPTSHGFLSWLATRPHRRHGLASDRRINWVSRASTNGNYYRTYLILPIMRKAIYILLFAFISSMTISACTEEEITPSCDDNGGGRGSTDGPF